MSVGPFLLLPVIERVKERCPELRKVEGAAELALTWSQATQVHPAAYALPVSERASPKEGNSQVVVQAVVVTFAIVLVVQNYKASQLGVEGIASLEVMLASVRRAIVGWQPDITHTSCELAESRLTRYDAGAIWWTQAFRCGYRLRHIS